MYGQIIMFDMSGVIYHICHGRIRGRLVISTEIISKRRRGRRVISTEIIMAEPKKRGLYQSVDVLRSHRNEYCCWIASLSLHLFFASLAFLLFFGRG